MKATTKEAPRKGSHKPGGKPEVAEAMVDALEDILRWERASERMLKAAEKAPAPAEMQH